jgi:hypothetical protein
VDAGERVIDIDPSFTGACPALEGEPLMSDLEGSGTPGDARGDEIPPPRSEMRPALHRERQAMKKTTRMRKLEWYSHHSLVSVAYPLNTEW